MTGPRPAGTGLHSAGASRTFASPRASRPLTPAELAARGFRPGVPNRPRKPLPPPLPPGLTPADVARIAGSFRKAP